MGLETFGKEQAMKDLIMPPLGFCYWGYIEQFWNAVGRALARICEHYAWSLKVDSDSLMRKALTAEEEGVGEDDLREVLRLLRAEQEARSNAEALGRGGFDRATLDYGIAVLRMGKGFDCLEGGGVIGRANLRDEREQ